MTLTQLFDLANLFVLPFWGLMIVLPNWGLTRRVMESYLPFVPLAGLYLVLLAGELNAETAQALANPQLAQIAQFFSDPQAAAIGWIHFLVMDLFVGRWIYWEGQNTGVWTVHSIVLCLFAGPVGVLSHILTRGVMQRWFADRLQSASSTAEPTAAALSK
jgi:hypothetical protein